MEKRILFLLFVGSLLVSAFYLLSPGEGAWALPEQNPGRQSIPTLTPTPGGLPLPTASPVPTSMPGGETTSTQIAPPSVPTPLSPTVVQKTAVAETRESIAVEGLGEWIITPIAFPTIGAAPPVLTPVPTPSRLPGPEATTALESPLAWEEGALSVRPILDLAVMGIGLTLLLTGLILVKRQGYRLPEP